MSEMIFIEKTGYDWFYIYNETLHEAGAIDGTLHDQLFSLVSYILEAHADEFVGEVIICSNAFVQNVLAMIESAFPTVKFVCINTPDVTRAFQRVFRDAHGDREIRGRNGKTNKTLYICSDGSYSAAHGLSGWAWVAADSTFKATDQYNFGVSNQTHIFLVELEGILRAIVDNRKKTGYSRIHVYCDSLHSVAIAHMIMGPQHKWDMTFMNSLQKRSRMLAEVAHATAQKRDITVSWVKGHGQHRLNIGADFLAREVWKAAEKGNRLQHDDPRVLASVKLVTR